VNPRGTSQMCSGCGNMVPKKLGQRWHTCTACGLSLHRDHNAARNILGALGSPGRWCGLRLHFRGAELGLQLLTGLLIGGDTALVTAFHWVLYLFGAFLIFTAVKMALSDSPWS